MRHPVFVLSLPFLLLPVLASCATPDAPDPWALPAPPPEDLYSGTLFALSHDYPEGAMAPPDPAPWQVAIDEEPIRTDNADAYVQSLKRHIAEDMNTLLFQYDAWDAAEAGWYNLPWLTEQDADAQPGILREAIHGTIRGSTFPPAMFPRSGLQVTMTTHVVTYYDEVAAGTLQEIWGRDAMQPVAAMEAGAGQFAEGSLIVKPAFATVDGDDWPPLAGAQTWTIYALPEDLEAGEPELMDVSLFQLDVIVKDSRSAPRSGWVFATFVYDKDAPGDAWDQLVPLGAMWGNDPEVDSPIDCDYLEPGGCPELAETWINPDAPLYARETLGWGGRLSGPNDGAVDLDPYVMTAEGPVPVEGRYPMSSCMSCHGVAEYEMQSFLLPSPADCIDEACRPTVEEGKLVYYEAGSPEFGRWFQSRPGDEPQDAGRIPLDYGMNIAFKALPIWYTSTVGTDSLNFFQDFHDYRGRRLH